jgi:inhibitor of KinA sporulation pathway (predicted exonuclease)
MDFSDNWHEFIIKLDKRHPRYNSQLTLPFDYQQEKDDGKGF